MSDRIIKVNELIAQQLGQIIRTEVELPSGAIVTITGVKTTADLQHASVFLSILPEDQEHKVMGILIKEVGNLRHLLSEKIIIRNTPKLKFIIDKTGHEAMEIEKLLDSLK